MDEEYPKLLVITVTAFLIISLTINILLASDPHAFSSPPLRVSDNFTGRGIMVPGYVGTAPTVAQKNVLFVIPMQPERD